ncbi:DciA family protein [Streptomyces nitrosporeus]|uniref:DciA family protein n=1 Tax=Streptomyces nitrosporeus TaxID=28894 RepID=UPI001E3A2525|nr:DciA family protein [Streptomyces nitrosporeus]
MSGSEVSGVDLARQALLAAREASKRNGAARQNPKRRTGTAVRRDGREPLGLGSAIGMMMTERGMAAPVAGGSVLAGFDTILAAVVPELAGRVQAVAFDAETGRLDVVPDAPACGTQLRWSAPKLVAAANERVSGANVRALHVLAPALVKAGPATAAAEPGLRPTAPVASVQRRTPPEGYRRAIEAHRQAVVPSRVDPGASSRRWSGRTRRCGSSAAARSPSRPWYRTMRQPRSTRPASSVAAKPRRPRPPRCAGPET